MLRLYPEYQQEFANDINHDLTFNMREGYEAEVSSVRIHRTDIFINHLHSIFCRVCYFFCCIVEQAESDIGPSLVLPSISEDDENQSDADSKHTANVSPAKSGIRSPLHAVSSPRHGKFLQR